GVAPEQALMARRVLREQLRELLAVEVVVARRVAVDARVAIPRREIQARLQALGTAGVHELADPVAAAAPERRALDRVLRGLRRPQAEAVVMLRGENHRAEPAARGRP